MACAPVPAVQTSPKVLATFTVLADMARNVAGGNLQIESITKVGMEIHGYEPTPQDIVRGQGASLLLENGLELDSWAERFYVNLPNVEWVTLSEGVKTIPIRSGEYTGKPNPHAWMSPRNALIYVENIRKAFVKLDPDRSSIYNQNAANYKAKIQQLDQELRQAIEAIPPGKRFIVTCEGAFSYLAADYGLQEVYLWATNSEQQGTPQQMARAITKIKENKIPVVFCESTVSDRTMKEVAAQTGAKYGGIFYVDSLTVATGAVPTYLALLRHNIQTLVRGLTDVYH